MKSSRDLVKLEMRGEKLGVHRIKGAKVIGGNAWNSAFIHKKVWDTRLTFNLTEAEPRFH